MTFNLLQGNFNLVFDFALLATLKLHQTVKRGGGKQRENKRQNKVIYQFYFQAWLKEKQSFPYALTNVPPSASEEKCVFLLFYNKSKTLSFFA